MRIVPKPDLEANITEQMSCGIKCLAAVSHYFNKDFPADLLQSLAKTPHLWITDLGSAALKLGFKEPIVYTYSHTIFEPEWLSWPQTRFLKTLAYAKSRSGEVNSARKSVIHFIDLGGRLRRGIVTTEIAKHYLKQKQPIIMAVASNVIHKTTMPPDGHYIALIGYDNKDFIILNPGKTVIKEEFINQNLILYALYQWGGWALTFETE